MLPTNPPVPPPRPSSRTAFEAHVLIVEDLERQQVALARTLQRFGCTTTAVADVSQAADACRDTPVDLVLVDCLVPGLDGEQGIRAVRALRSSCGRRRPVVALLGTAPAAERGADLLRHQVDDHLRKPVREQDLLACLSRWAGHRRLPGRPADAPMHRAGEARPAPGEGDTAGVSGPNAGTAPDMIGLPPADTARPHAQDTYTVLVADEDRDVRDGAREALAAAEVLTAADGAAALALLQRGAVDLILLSATLPGARTVLGVPAPEADAPPVVLLAEPARLEGLDPLLEARALDLVAKPLDFAVLSHRLRYLVRTHRTLRGLREHEQRLLTTQRVANVGDWELDPATDRLILSQVATRLLGLPARVRGEFRREDLLARLDPAERDGWMRLLADAIETRRHYQCEFRLAEQGEDGPQWLLQHTVIGTQAGGEVRVCGTLQDITSRRAQELQIRRLAYYDDVTGLPNRRHFKERLAEALEQASRRHRALAVLFIDLDEFKRINDTLGHTFGDMLLRQIADRIAAVVRESDAIGSGFDSCHAGAQAPALAAPCTEQDVEDAGADGARNSAGHVARLGGDEFVILLQGIRRDDDARGVAARIVNVLGRPVVIDGHDMRVTPSIGVAMYPRDGRDVDTLLRCADTAMYHAKSLGRNRFEFFSRELGEQAQRRLTLEGRLRAALRGSEFSLVYQPQVALASGRCVGVEALIRWESEGRTLAPEEFIPVAESCGLIIEIGEWVLSEVLRQIALWREQAVAFGRVAINTSVIQFNRGRLCEVIDYVTEPHDVLTALEVEITEHTLTQVDPDVLRSLATLRRRGMRVSVDDFGTGYSNLSNLRHLPLDALKVDRSFVAGLPGQAGDRAIVGAIISMARQLGLDVVAEGVETAAQRDWLHEQQCDIVQGFLLGRPAPPAGISALLSGSGASPTELPAGR